MELLLDLGASTTNERGQKARDFALACNRKTNTTGWNAVIAVLDRYTSGVSAVTGHRGTVPRQTSAEDVLMTMLAKGLKRVLR